MFLSLLGLLACTTAPDLASIDDTVGAIGPVAFAAARLVAANGGDDGCTTLATGGDGALGTVHADAACPVPAVGGEGDLGVTGVWSDGAGTIAVAFPAAGPWRASVVEGVVVEAHEGVTSLVFADASVAVGDAVSVGEVGLVVTLEPGEVGPGDDRFIVTGGAQYVYTDDDGEARTDQVVFVDLVLDAACVTNPVGGSATLQQTRSNGKKVSIEEIHLGFHEACDGTTDVELAVGPHAGATGTAVALHPLR